jgi:lactoylglutathione lyase
MRTLHIGLRVADLQRSLAFYRALGYEVVGEVPETGIGRLTMLKLPDDDFVSVELVHDPPRGSVDPGGFDHLVVGVDDVRAFVRQLSAHGVDAEEPSSPDGSDEFWTATLSDPDGYRVELVQWPPGHPAGMTGADFAGSAAQDEPDG